MTVLISFLKTFVFIFKQKTKEKLSYLTSYSNVAKAYFFHNFTSLLQYYRLLVRFALMPKLQCCGSMTFWCGSGSVSDPPIFVIDLQEAIKNYFVYKFF
jgi:hypothetical protein